MSWYDESGLLSVNGTEQIVLRYRLNQPVEWFGMYFAIAHDPQRRDYDINWHPTELGTWQDVIIPLTELVGKITEQSQSSHLQPGDVIKFIKIQSGSDETVPFNTLPFDVEIFKIVQPSIISYFKE